MSTRYPLVMPQDRSRSPMLKSKNGRKDCPSALTPHCGYDKRDIVQWSTKHEREKEKGAGGQYRACHLFQRNPFVGHAQTLIVRVVSMSNTHTSKYIRTRLPLGTPIPMLTQNQRLATVNNEGRPQPEHIFVDQTPIAYD